MAWDLRSDFLAPPLPSVVAAMARAAAEPSGFGLREDPSQHALEREVARLLGKEDALLFPTCTMANLVAVAAQLTWGEALVAEAESHMVISEAGGIAAVAGAVVHTVAGTAGCLPLDVLSALLARGGDVQRPRVAMVLLETTHNRAGGVALPADHIAEVGALCRRHGAALHVDGARFLNAAVALGLEPAALAAPADTVSLSLNKALGAPNGAVLAGTAAVIDRALALRQRFGGGIRPAGAMAAAGLEALEGFAGRLAADHACAARLADLLRAGGIGVTPRNCTSILLAEPPVRDLPAYLDRLARRGVLALHFGPGRIRLCLHRGIAAADVDTIAQAMIEAVSGG